ncbi:hypothetical protein EZV62_001102 [Acer yangbiense]|uniref:Replication factor A C-terminal domain-containing protein n=1 Tax=Acer yangbiense TaxID=1000413 RepID=A0A5C7ISY1_9ROSI|nr:hypothetical protein EZV62_001102 [Acer yangbiense]
MFHKRRNEEIRITLWADVAMNFDEQILATLYPPVFIAITGLKVKEYQGKLVLSSSYSTMCFFNPDVPQLSEYKKRYKINCIIENNTDQTSFLIMGRAAEKLLGISCQTLVMEQGYDDPYRLPLHLEKLIGTAKKFLIRFGKQENEIL